MRTVSRPAWHEIASPLIGSRGTLPPFEAATFTPHPHTIFLYDPLISVYVSHEVSFIHVFGLQCLRTNHIFMRATCPAHIIILHFKPLTNVVSNTKHEAPHYVMFSSPICYFFCLKPKNSQRPLLKQRLIRSHAMIMIKIKRLCHYFKATS